MKTLIVVLLVAWLVVALLGVLLEGLFWLLVIGALLFVGTAVWGWLKLPQSAPAARLAAPERTSRAATPDPGDG